MIGKANISLILRANCWSPVRRGIWDAGASCRGPTEQSKCPWRHTKKANTLWQPSVSKRDEATPSQTLSLLVLTLNQSLPETWAGGTSAPQDVLYKGQSLPPSSQHQTALSKFRQDHEDQMRNSQGEGASTGSSKIHLGTGSLWDKGRRGTGKTLEEKEL